MANWEKFEQDCTDYLNKKFGAYAEFIHQGGTNSKLSDILVKTASGKRFYIDAKQCPAQCGQFVLLPNVQTGRFVYSTQNAHPANAAAKQIMEHMDAYFEEFREAGTAGKKIEMENGSQIFASWIIQAYKDKGTRFFITNGYKIFRIEDFREYFSVSSKYRIKRSGSSNVGKSRIAAVLGHIRGMGLGNISCRTSGDKLFVSLDREMHDRRFVLGEYEYMFSRRGEEYEIRRLSNTYNANVIFSIELKGTKPGLSKDSFIAALR